MTDAPMPVLLVEQDADDASAVEAMLAGAGEPTTPVTRVGTLAEAVSRLAENGFAIVLLNLSLPDSTGLETLRRLQDAAPELPIVVLANEEDRGVALQAVHHGAQDYVPKARLDAEILKRSLRYALERQRLVAEMRAMSLHDELTGLYNRRGFTTLGEQQLPLAVRSGAGMGLFFLDVDGLGEINARYGREAGDRTLRETAEVLRRTFRFTDIQARLGGDEFAVLAVNADERGMSLIMQRLRRALRQVNSAGDRAFPLALGIGTAHLWPNLHTTLGDLIVQAEAALYREREADGDADGG